MTKELRSREEDQMEEQEEHNREEEAFKAGGWSTLDVVNPFYDHPNVGLEDGKVKTVAETEVKSPGPDFDWFVKSGDVTPPEGTWRYRQIFESKDGKWEKTKEEDAK